VILIKLKKSDIMLQRRALIVDIVIAQKLLMGKAINGKADVDLTLVVERVLLVPHMLCLEVLLHVQGAIRAIVQKI
jgi:hypothetical protein